MSGDGANKDDFKSTAAYLALTKKFGAEPGLADLLKLADDAVVQAKDVTAPKGDAKKTVNGVYQWFQANWGAISPILDDLALDGDDEEEEDEDEDEDNE
jgi:hypothetical protein